MQTTNLSPLGLTRDNKLVLWLTAAAALVAYLMADGRPPTDWGYADWLKFAAAVFAYLSAKLQSSPLAHSEGK